MGALMTSQEAIMGSEHFFVAALVLHVVGVVLWIGGVAFITTALLPTLRGAPDAQKSMALFIAIEERFRAQAKFVVLVTGLSGMFMLTWMHAWGWYLNPLTFWWVYLMTLVWLVFTLVIFVFEPLFLSRKFHDLAGHDPREAFRLIHRLLWVLLTLSLIAIVGAVGGAYA